MTTKTEPLCWAVAMLFLAAGAATGLMDSEAVTTMLMVMPVLAVVSLQQRNTCCGWNAK